MTHHDLYTFIQKNPGCKRHEAYLNFNRHQNFGRSLQVLIEKNHVIRDEDKTLTVNHFNPYKRKPKRRTLTKKPAITNMDKFYANLESKNPELLARLKGQEL